MRAVRARRFPSLGFTFQSEITRFYGDLIFPDTFGSPLGLESTVLYVHERLGDPNDGTLSTFAYEEKLHSCFWPGESDDNPLLFIEGREGVGKSTLLRYYLDYFLPQYATLIETDFDKAE